MNDFQSSHVISFRARELGFDSNLDLLARAQAVATAKHKAFVQLFLHRCDIQAEEIEGVLDSC
jgi:hypothetical protein